MALALTGKSRTYMRESVRAKEAFQAYLAMGPERSVQKLADNWNDYGIGKPISYDTLARYCRQFNWRDRAAEQDELTYAEIQQELAARQRREMVHRALQRFRITGRMMEQVETAIEGLPAGRDTFTMLAFDGSGKMMLDWYNTATKSDRLDLGEATARNEQSGGFGPAGSGSREGGGNDDAPAFRPVTTEEEAEMRKHFKQLMGNLRQIAAQNTPSEEAPV